MMPQQPPEWTKRFITWLSHQPKWFLAVGAIVLIAVIVLFMGDMRQPTIDQVNNGGDLINDPTTLALGVFLRLILVVIAIYIAAMLFRRWQTGTLKRPDRQLSLLETLQLNPRRAIHLVRAGEQVFLIGATDQSISILGQVPSPKDAETQTEPGLDDLNFSQHLSLANQIKPQTTEFK